MITLSSKIDELIRKNSIILKDRHLLCCVSGGADSMALLHFFHSNSDQYGLASVCACHLNHNARGAESDSDEALVKEFCDSLGIRLITGRLENIDPGAASEELFRDLRYEFFRSAAEETGSDLVATGHTMNDNAETVIFRLARGTGLRGASGIPAVRGEFIRPLLYCSREDTESYCRLNGVPFCVDSSNESDRYARNVIRHHVMPVLERISSGSLEALAGFAGLSAEADAYFEAEAQRLIAGTDTGAGVRCSVILESMSPLDSYIVRRIISGHCSDPDRRTVERCLQAVRDGKRTEISPDVFLDCSGGICRIVGKYDRKELGPVPFADFRADGRNCLFELKELSADLGDERDLFYYCVDYDKLIGVVSVRNRRDGDHFRSAYRRQSKSLKKLFNEKKYTAEKRDSTILLTDDTGIVWMEGEGPAEGKEIGPDTKKVIIFHTLDTFGG